MSIRRGPSRGLPLPMVLVLTMSCFLLGLYWEDFSGFGDQERGDAFPVLGKEPLVATATRVENRHEVFAVPESVVAPHQEAPGGSLAEGAGVPHMRKTPISVDLPLPEPTGDKGVDGNSYISEIPYQILSWHPRAVYFPNFADHARCDLIVEAANRRLAPSGLALRKGDTASGTADVRTSLGTFMGRNDDRHGALAWVEDKMAQATLVHPRHGEPFNVLRYELGQKYDSHYDTFDPASYGPQPSQRIASFLLYMSDVEEGGETIFPAEGPGGLARLRGIDYKSCDVGLKVKPRKGDALLFYSIHPNGTFDKHALHGGCPVKKGTKWVATKWIRDKCFGNC